MSAACIIGNCQAQGLAEWLSALSPGMQARAFSLTGVTPGDPQALSALDALIAGSDLVVMQAGPAHRARFGLPEPEVLRAQGRRVAAAPWILFRGFHPDCVHLFHAGQAVPGAAGPLHSALAAAAALEGLTQERALGLFNAYAYARLGYFEALPAALATMETEWRNLGLDPGRWLAPQTTPFMHTVNHPVPAVLEDVARQVLAQAGLKAVTAFEAPPDRLLPGGIWPLYPEIAQRLGLDPAVAGTAYRRPGLPDTPLEQTVEAAYCGLAAAMQDGAPFDDALVPAVARARAFIRAEVG